MEIVLSIMRYQGYVIFYTNYRILYLLYLTSLNLNFHKIRIMPYWVNSKCLWSGIWRMYKVVTGICWVPRINPEISRRVTLTQISRGRKCLSLELIQALCVCVFSWLGTVWHLPTPRSGGILYVFFLGAGSRCTQVESLLGPRLLSWIYRSWAAILGGIPGTHDIESETCLGVRRMAWCLSMRTCV